jgi:hypothetical protein
MSAVFVKLPVFFRLFVLDGHVWRCKGKESHQRGSATRMKQPSLSTQRVDRRLRGCPLVGAGRAMNPDSARPKCRIAPERKTGNVSSSRHHHGER